MDRHLNALHQVEASLPIADQLLAGADVLEKGDPSLELESSRQIVLNVTQNAERHRDLCKKCEAGIELLQPLCRELRKLLPIAWLLDEPDHHARAEELHLRLEAAKAATVTLNGARLHRLLLDEKLDVLRRPPPSDTEVVDLRARRNALEQQQGNSTKALMSLNYVNEHRAALGWTDAEGALRRQTQLAPALQEQLERAKKAASDAESRLDDAEKALQIAMTAVNDADAKAKSIEESLNRDREDWLQFRIEDASDEVVGATASKVSEYEAEIAQLESQEGQLVKQVNQLELLRSQADEGVASASKQLDDAESAWKPEQERWQRLQATAEGSGVLAGVLTSRFIEAFSGQGSPNLRQRARERATALKERLARAREVEQVQAAVEQLLGPQELSGEIYLQAWLEVRNWLRRRMPTQIAEVDEPLEALGRLKEHLRLLEIRLLRQESELRGESEDVARNIDIHIRRAQKQMKRLNLDLEDARFGSIQGVRLHLQRMERMDQVLSALREGQAQELLFKPEMPIEDALEEIFKRFAGGRTGGQKLLDYREYLDPKVTVKRKGSEEWEVVNANRLSTGEGIGIGAAVMMVVLAAWERDANLLRPKRSHGTLRLLFLDEANRLDKENLGVLFDLCQNLELQLVVAAPEVARAEGNTTYRLVRRLGDDGREEVIVSGRRAVVGASV
jgi:chromosome partition protein MukB